MQIRMPYQAQLRRLAKSMKAPEISLLFSVGAVLLSAYPYLRAAIATPRLTLALGTGVYESEKRALRLTLIASNNGNRDAVLLSIRPCDFGTDPKQNSCSAYPAEITPALPILLRPGEIKSLDLRSTDVAEEQLIQSVVQHDDDVLNFLGLEVQSMDASFNRYEYTHPIAQLWVVQNLKHGFRFVGYGIEYDPIHRMVLSNRFIRPAPLPPVYTSQPGYRAFRVHTTRSTYDEH